MYNAPQYLKLQLTLSWLYLSFALVISQNITQNTPDILVDSADDNGNITSPLMFLNATRTETRCSPTRGRNLNPQSCEEIISLIPDIDVPLLGWNGEYLTTPV